MGQKVHPLGFRLGVSKHHFSYWFSKPSNYFFLVQEDIFIRDYIFSRFSDFGISDIQIKRNSNFVIVNIHSVKPSLFVGSNVSLLEDIQKDLSSLLSLKFSFRDLTLNFIEILNSDSNSRILSLFISQQLEKRIPFRKVIKSALLKAHKSTIKGIKIQISGRLNGAEIARTEWVREGQVPLHTIKSNIDYCNYKARLILIFKNFYKSVIFFSYVLLKYLK
jgi:small subunit ribosomal protein S3